MSGFRETNRRYIKTNNQEISTKRAFDSTLLKYNCKRFDGKLKEIRFTRTESVRVSVPVTEQGIKHPSFKQVKSIKTIESAIKTSEPYVNTTEYESNNSSPQHYAEDFIISRSKATGRIAATSARRTGRRIVTKPISKKSKTEDRENISSSNLSKTANHYRPVNIDRADLIKNKPVSIKQREARNIHAKTMKPAPVQTNRQNTINPNQPHNITSAAFAKEHTAIGTNIRTSKKVEKCRTFVNIKPGNNDIRTRESFVGKPSAVIANSRNLSSVGNRKKSKIVEKGRTTAVDRFAPKHGVPTSTIHKSFHKQHTAFVNRYKISRILIFRKPARLGLRRKLKDRAKKKQTAGILMKTLAGGGGLTVAVVLICVLLGGAFFLYGDTGTTSYQDVNEKVQGYQALIEENCEKYELPEFVDLVKAVMMQESGEVTFAGWNGGYGKCIKISHIGDLKVDGATVETIYAHLSEIKVRVGQKVVRGQYIGEVGNTGNSTGPHLHMGVLVDGEFINPERGWVRLE